MKEKLPELRRLASSAVTLKLITEKEHERAEKIITDLLYSWDITHFSSATKNEQINKQVHEYLLALIKGESQCAKIKQDFIELKQQDMQGIRAGYLTPILFGIPALCGVLACLLVPILLWPIVLFIAPIALILSMISLKYIVSGAEHRQRILNNSWNALDSFTCQLTQEDIDIFGKLNSPDFIGEVEKKKLTEQQKSHTELAINSIETPSSFFESLLVKTRGYNHFEHNKKSPLTLSHKGSHPNE